MTRRSDTQSVAIEAPPEAVFDFLSEPTNLPGWAIGFAKEIRREGDGWLVLTPQGEMPIRYATVRGLGTIDFHIAPEPGAELVAYSRVIPNDRGAEYVFTQFQAPGMPDEMFEGQIRALRHELTTLKALLEVDCPTQPESRPE